jgi:hypothetical protein
MKSAHASRGITNAKFDALVGDLLTTLNMCKVGEREQSMLLSVLSPMRQDIVERRYSPSGKGGANDDEEGRAVGRVDGIYPGSFSRDGLL